MADAEVLQANGTAERDAALVMIEAIAGDHQVTIGADKNHDTKDFVQETRNLNATPQVAQKTIRGVRVPLMGGRPGMPDMRSVSRSGNEWKRFSAG